MALVNGIAQIIPGSPTLHKQQTGQEDPFDLEELLSGRASGQAEARKSPAKKDQQAAAWTAPQPSISLAQAIKIVTAVLAATRELEDVTGLHELDRPSLLGSAYV
ncbi:MAG: hypothetical protein KJ621_04895 [Proteobacteria bacterium]|nr:hypothetical protein [Pseudomonadota bacterium]